MIWDRPAQRVARYTVLRCPLNVLLATQCYVAREDICNEKKLLHIFPSKDDIERRRNSENFTDVYLWRHALHY
jgi:hypothetical protein